MMRRVTLFGGQAVMFHLSRCGASLLSHIISTSYGASTLDPMNHMHQAEQVPPHNIS
jgi:hypothetical protein